MISAQQIQGPSISCPDPHLRGQGTLFLLLLGAIILLHVALCVWFHFDRDFLGDEWGSIGALDLPYRALLTQFGGWRTMNFYLCGLKFLRDQFGAANWLLVLPGIIGGCWLVTLVAAVSLRLGGTSRAALVCALLAAINPWLVSYAVMVRSYILLAALTTAMFLALLNWHAHGRWRDGAWVGLYGALAFLMHLNALYALSAAGVLAIGWTGSRLRAHAPHTLRRLIRLAVPVSLLVALAAAAHLPMWSDIVKFRQEWSATPPTSLAYLPAVATLFFGGHYLVLPSLAGILYGAWKTIHDRTNTSYAILMVIVPVTAMSLAGVSHHAHAYARFHIAILPVLILLIGYGIGTATSRLGMLVASLLLGCLAWTNVAAIQSAHNRALQIPFHRIAMASSPLAKSVLLGPDVHNYGLELRGVKVRRNMVDALSSSSPQSAICLNVIDFADYTWGIPGVTLSTTRVSQMVGTPQQIADRLIATWRARLAAKSRPTDPPRMARELAALLRWRGNSSEAAHYEQLARQTPPTNSRIR